MEVLKTLPLPFSHNNESWPNSIMSHGPIELSPQINFDVWFMSISSAFLVGLTGILPMFLMPQDLNVSKRPSDRLRLMLAFAVGGLLGDVFLHLLPEAWDGISSGTNRSTGYIFMGLWVVIGIFTFVFIEVIAGQSMEGNQSETCNNNKKNEHVTSHVTGYLNLLANGIDNFTHGLSVSASFMVSNKFGMLTTFAIILHEVPHELGDYAILLKSGFSKWEAAKAQIVTASIGVLGAVTALSTSEMAGQKTAWILPFTAGGFIHISLVSILPELIQENNPRESMKQLLCIGVGIAIMALVNSLGH